MEIVKPGKLPTEDIYEGICRNCGCKVRCGYYEVDDEDMVECPTEGCDSEICTHKVTDHEESVKWRREHPVKF